MGKSIFTSVKLPGSCMEIVSGGCNAGISGIGAGFGICCAHAGGNAQIEKPKVKIEICYG